jgi:hypothetical protein
LSISNSLNPNPSKKDQDTVEEKEEEEPSQQEDGWYEVGKKNRSVVTRTVTEVHRWIFELVANYYLR